MVADCRVTMDKYQKVEAAELTGMPFISPALGNPH